MEQPKSLSPSEQILGIPADAVSHYIEDPSGFVEDLIFKGPVARSRPGLKLSREQREMLWWIAHTPLVAIRSGRGEGKTAALAFAILWFLFTRPEGTKVLATGPKYEQLKKTLWAECSKWLSGSCLTMLIKWTNEQIYYAANPAQCFAFMATAKDLENISGLHEDHMLFLCDEAPGIEDIILETLMGSMTHEDNRMVISGNPTRINGFFYDAFHANKNIWRTLHYNSEVSPFTSKKWLTRMQTKWPRDSDVYRSSVLGEFPYGNPEAFIQLTQATAARTREVKADGAVEIGCDVARYGDDLTVITVRQGLHIFPQKIMAKKNNWEVASGIYKTVQEYREITRYEGTIKVKVDDTGVGGGVTDILLNNPAFRGEKFDVVPINFAMKGNAEYSNVVSMMWGNLKDMIDIIELPDDDDLINEIASRTFKQDKDKRIVIQPKDEYKRKYKDSPDRADSLILCLAKDTGTRRVMATFDSYEQQNNKSFEIAWNRVSRVNSLHYAAMAQGKDESLSLAGALWDNITGKLYVYCEKEYDMISPVQVAFDCVNTLKMNEYAFTRMVCNDIMFDREKRTGTATVINKELEKQTFQKVKIRPSRKYDIHACISLAVQMFYFSRIVIHDGCRKMFSQVQGWDIQRGKALTEGFGFCECLLLMIAELRHEMPQIADYVGLRDYWRPANFGLTHSASKPIAYEEPKIGS